MIKFVWLKMSKIVVAAADGRIVEADDLCKRVHGRSEPASIRASFARTETASLEITVRQKLVSDI